jgi:hypothetical protein
LLDIARYSTIGHDWITLDGAVESFGASETWEMRQRFDMFWQRLGPVRCSDTLESLPLQLGWKACSET